MAPFSFSALVFTMVASIGISSCGNEDTSGSQDAGRSDASEQGPAVDADLSPDAGTVVGLRVSWSLEGGCLGGDEVETEIRSKADGRTFLRRDPCVANGTSLSDPLPIGELEVLVRVFDNDIVVPPDSGPVPGPLVAQSDLSGPHQSAQGEVVDVAIGFPTGTALITSSWGFSLDGVAQDCAAAGVANVDLSYSLIGDGDQRQVRVPCATGLDLSGALPTGSYLVRATALDGADVAVFAQVEIELALFVGNLGANAAFAFSNTN